MKKLPTSLIILTFILLFGSLQIFAQLKNQIVGNIVIKVGSDIVLQVPVNSLIPLIKGNVYRVETLNISSMFQIDTSAISIRRNKATVTFKITNQINSNKFRHLTKRFDLKIGKRKKFNFKVILASESQNYSVVAFYEPKQINNEQLTTDN